MLSPTLLASIVTVIPAMVLIGFILRRYEGLFVDAKVFFAIVGGLFGGLLISFLETFAFAFDDPELIAALGSGTAFLSFVIGYAFFEAGLAVAFTGLSAFRGRRDAPYYGFAFGAAAGAMIALQRLAIHVRILEENGGQDSLGTFLNAALVPIAGILLFAVAGAYAASGQSIRKPWKGWGIATLILMASTLARWLLRPNLGQATMAGVGTGLIILILAILLQGRALRIMDAIVPPEIKRRALREERKQRREGRT